MIQLLRVMQRVSSLHYYVIIAHHYVIITEGPIITHYYIFQSPELADGPLPDASSLAPCQRTNGWDPGHPLHAGWDLLGSQDEVPITEHAKQTSSSSYRGTI